MKGILLFLVSLLPSPAKRHLPLGAEKKDASGLAKMICRTVRSTNYPTRIPANPPGIRSDIPVNVHSTRIFVWIYTLSELLNLQ